MSGKGKKDIALHAAANVLISALERKHPYTKGHSIWVEQNTIKLARQLPGAWSDKDIEHLGIGARLHDIGKICVEEATLDYQGTMLSTEQIREIEDHPFDGWQILRKSGISFPDIVRDAILYHHESYNGDHEGDLRGYPFGFSGESIPLPGRLVAVVDTFNALTTKRSYNNLHSINEAEKLLLGMAGNKLDPALVKLFAKKIIPQL